MNMLRSHTIIRLVIGFVCYGGAAQTQTVQPPNIIIIYSDDMGVGDVGFAGGKVAPTPNIDALAYSGKTFTQYYSNAPVCSPSRVAITTGMYPGRWGIHTFLSGKKFNANCEQQNYLDTQAPSLARYLKHAGYATAHFGKWHMGGGRDVKDAPSIYSFGFDEYASTWESPDPDPLLTDSNWIWSPTDSVKRWNRTAYFVDKTLAFLQKEKGKPCFINLWPDDVHTPWVHDEQSEAKKNTWFTQPNLPPVLAEFDKQIGRLIAGVAALGLTEKTLIIFTSDNGPAPSFDQLRTNALRGEKNSLYEGGIRMPFIISWPSHIAAGSADSTTVIAAMDLLPTLSAIAGIEKSNLSAAIDGEDMSAVFLDHKAVARKQELFWEYGRNNFYNYPDAEHRSMQIAVRHKQWKCYTVPDGSKVELYNLQKDPFEKSDVSKQETAITEKLKQSMMAWYKEMDKSHVK